MVPALAASLPKSVRELLNVGGLRAVYQPIVVLEDRSVIGYEALARGPVGSPLEFPADLFAAARKEGLLAKLDRACRAEALSRAVAAGLDEETLLFVNVEPGGLDNRGVLSRMAEGQLKRVSVVVELTERALADRPREVLRGVRWLRERGCRIALDDVGLDPRSLALMPLLAPDVIKLDKSLLHERLPALEVAKVLHAVAAETERSGAVILAEGIERDEQVPRAQAMGATIGQGWLFGRPEPLESFARPRRPFELPRHVSAAGPHNTPFELIADERRLRLGEKRLLLSLSRQLEEETLALRAEAVVLAAFQDQRYFDAATRARYEQLAQTSALVGALGVGLGRHPAPGVRGADLLPDDPLCNEWDVIVVAPHFACAFVARDRRDDVPERDRRFDYSVTYDRALVTAAAESLLRRIIRST